MLARVMCSVELLGLLLEPTISTSQGRQAGQVQKVTQAGLVAMKEDGQVPRRQRAQPSNPKAQGYLGREGIGWEVEAQALAWAS